MLERFIKSKLNRVVSIAIMVILVISLTGCFKNVEEKKDTTPPVQMQKVVLYLPNAEASGVTPITFEMEKTKVSPTAVLTKLIAEESKDEYSVFPKGLIVKKVSVNDGLAYVEFNDAFLKTGAGGSLTERLELASIVNTLTEFKEIKEVMFIVNGEPVNQISGHVDMTNPLHRNDELIVKANK